MSNRPTTVVGAEATCTIYVQAYHVVTLDGVKPGSRFAAAHLPTRPRTEPVAVHISCVPRCILADEQVRPVGAPLESAFLCGFRVLAAEVRPLCRRGR